MTIWIFISLMLIFCVTDLKYFHISNWLVLPAICIALYFSGNWIPVLKTGNFAPLLVVACVGALFFYNETICPHCGKVAEVIKTPLSCFAGGDVKLMILAAALLGYRAIGIFIVSRILVWLYRKLFHNNGVLPYAPFFTLASIPFLFVI